MLSEVLSCQLREKLLAEVAVLKTNDELALWAHRHLAAKNTLTADDARILEAGYQTILDGIHAAVSPLQTAEDKPERFSNASKETKLSSSTAQHRPVQAKPVRRRNKAHLIFVAAQRCLICQRSPCDAHHLKFAQPKALGRKVSDEFTVPLCRVHHDELHRGSNEMAWWKNLQIAPIEVAKTLWQTNPANQEPRSV